TAALIVSPHEIRLESLTAVERTVKREATPCARWTLFRVRLGHLAVVEGLVQHGLLDALLPRDLAQGAAGGGGLLHDLGRTVVADVRVERGRSRQRQLRVALAVLAVGLDPVDAPLGEETARAREQLHGVEDVAREQRHEDV